MPILEIDGVGRVDVGQEFLKLSPEQQHATVQEIAASVKKPQDSGIGSYIPKAISDIPGEVGNAYKEAYHGVVDNLAGKGEQGPVEGFLNTGKGLLNAAYIGSILPAATGVARSLIGHPMADATHAIGTLINPEVAARDNPDEMYQHAKGNVDTAMMGLAARGGAPPGRVAPSPQPPTTGPLGVTLSEGQATRDLPAIQREQIALRAPSGPGGSRAQQFAAQQAQEVAAARDRVSQSFDQFGQRVAETPQDAGQIVQQSIQNEAANRKANVTQAYDTAKALPGAVDVGSFTDIGKSIKTDLSSRPDPIVIDDKLTPFAAHAIKDVEQRVNNLQIQNRADPTATTGGFPSQPSGTQIAGVTLEGVDQMRRRLSAFRKDAYGSGNSADGRAAQGVLDAFDNHIDQAINSGAFKGDPRAVQAWNIARAAHADYKATFGKAKNDPVGRVVEKILGTKDNPAAIPNDVADFLYGGSGVNPNSLNVAVTKRVRGILGDQSPEWTGTKQGIFSRLVETPPGMTDMGPGKIAQRVNRFLTGDGKELAETMFSPAERSLMKQYADLNRALEVPQAGANWSNTSTVLAPLLKKAGQGIATLVGGAIGHVLAPGLHGVGEVAGGAVAGKIATTIGGMSETRQIMKQMPLVNEAAQRFQRALTAYNKANTPPSRVALSVATTNFARSLRPLGIDLSAAGVGSAEDNQQQVQRPPGQ